MMILGVTHLLSTQIKAFKDEIFIYNPESMITTFHVTDSLSVCSQRFQSKTFIQKLTANAHN
jgi:hypothetical protein